MSVRFGGSLRTSVLLIAHLFASMTECDFCDKLGGGTLTPKRRTDHPLDSRLNNLKSYVQCAV